jgi:hypothetical protein
MKRRATEDVIPEGWRLLDAASGAGLRGEKVFPDGDTVTVYVEPGGGYWKYTRTSPNGQRSGGHGYRVHSFAAACAAAEKAVAWEDSVPQIREARGR